MEAVAPICGMETAPVYARTTWNGMESNGGIFQASIHRTSTKLLAAINTSEPIATRRRFYWMKTRMKIRPIFSADTNSTQ